MQNLFMHHVRMRTQLPRVVCQAVRAGDVCRKKGPNGSTQ